MNKKIFILLPDGNGLRNFIFGDFGTIIKTHPQIKIWNNSPVNLEEKGFKEIVISNFESAKFTDTIKGIKRIVEIRYNAKSRNNNKYFLYNIEYKPTGKFSRIKKTANFFANTFLVSKTGISILDKLMNFSESKSSYYKECVQTLKAEKPDLVFCTNQRPLTCIAPILAAKKLNIPTATFIFSWDNIPKATMVIKTDYYLVWSEYMKNELLAHYSDINEKQIIVTGSPQFENHFNTSFYISKEEFFKQHQLDLSYKHICFSGNDATSSPYDQHYLKDLALAVRKLNEQGNKIKIIFRRCPVDFSDRFKTVLSEFNDVIVNIETLTTNHGAGWNAYVPDFDDIKLQTNLLRHVEFVVNIGSTMAFDAVCHDKPCIYIDYNHPENDVENWDINNIYQFIHFQSMPNKDAVVWINSADEYETKILELLRNPEPIVENAKKWFSIINSNPENIEPSAKIWQALNAIANN